MARQKRNSTALITTAERRLSGMKIISPKLDLGGGCSTSNLDSKIKDVRTKLTAYNDLLTKVDAAANELDRAEKALAHISNKVLPGVATRYDKESDQYEMVGGTRPSERKRPARKLAAV